MATKNEKIEYALSLSTTAFNRSVKLVSGKMDRMSKDITRSMKRANRSIGSLATNFAKVGVVAAAAAAGGLYLFNRELSKTVDLASEQEKQEVKLAGVIRATGEAAGLSFEELKKYASGLQDITTSGDETILSGMAILATFKQIKGDQFKDATKAAVDMSVVMEQDLKASIVMIGKALNDPIANLSAMTRAGVQFTDSQKEMIKQLAGSGDMMGAQKIILKELESQFGSVAEALRKTFTGQVDSAKNTLGDLKEEIGFTITKNNFFIESAKLINEIFKGWAESIKENRGEWMKWSKGAALAVIQFSADFANGINSTYKMFQELNKVMLLAYTTILRLTNGVKYYAKAIAELKGDDAALNRLHIDRLNIQYDIQQAYEDIANAEKKAESGLPLFSKIAESLQKAKDKLSEFAAVEVDPAKITEETIKEVDTAIKKVGDTWVSYRKSAKDATDGAQEDAETSMDRFKDEWGRTWSEVEKDGKDSIQAILAEIEKLRREAEKPITIPIESGHKEGGPIGFNSGGRVPGGWGGGDRIRALLEPGEFVMRKEAVSKWGMGFMLGLNSMAGNFKSMAMASLPPLRMAQGGPVPAGGPSGLIGVDLRITDSAPVKLYGTKQQIMEMQRQKKQMVNRRS